MVPGSLELTQLSLGRQTYRYYVVFIASDPLDGDTEEALVKMKASSACSILPASLSPG